MSKQQIRSETKRLQEFDKYDHEKEIIVEKRNQLESNVFEKQTTLATQEIVVVCIGCDSMQYDYALKELKKMIEWMEQVEYLERDLMKQKLQADEERKEFVMSDEAYKILGGNTIRNRTDDQSENEKEQELIYKEEYIQK
ncbi:MAG: hypothetical protein EZS28_052444 [Streblomastix strix]|uniref:Uncharacterized protein n=1 Tax=Streblomastix strix TaxID=222440 RepID=A0A5J4S8B2_9EUKA|nr:MAG: hypothetical protein EZS28_052444 [Streblomastix strix]